MPVGYNISFLLSCNFLQLNRGHVHLFVVHKELRFMILYIARFYIYVKRLPRGGMFCRDSSKWTFRTLFFLVPDILKKHDSVHRFLSAIYCKTRHNLRVLFLTSLPLNNASTAIVDNWIYLPPNSSLAIAFVFYLTI